MSDPVANYPLCGNASSQLFDRREFRDHPFTNRLCQHCGLVYQSPRMSASELEAFYADEYRQLYQGSAGPNPKDLAVQSARARVLADFLTRQVAQVARYLDIGCSAGLLLQQFEYTFHSQAYGIEPGEAYRDYAPARGLPYGSSAGRGAIRLAAANLGKPLSIPGGKGPLGIHPGGWPGRK